MKKTIFFLLSIVLSLVAPSSWAQNVTTVANGTATNTYIPIYGFFADEYIRQQIIYPAEMLTDMENSSISAMTFYLNELPDDDWSCAFQFQLGNTNQSAFSASPNQYLTSSFTTIYTNTLVIDAVTNTMTITFSTPYTYTGGNLLLDIQNTEPGNYAEAHFYGINTNHYASAYGYNEYGMWDIGVAQFLPKTTFTHSDESNCLAPNNLQMSEIGIYEATLSWSPLNGQNTWRLYCDTGIVNLEQVSWIPVNPDTFYTFTALEANTSYTAYIQTVCGTEQSNISTINFNTLSAPPSFPFTCDFENMEEHTAWTLVNSTQANQWFIDTAVNHTTNGHFALYVSQNNGLTNSYNNSSNSDTWAYRDIQLIEAAEFQLSFDWRGNGESCCDYLKVFIGSAADVTAGSVTAPQNATVLFNKLNMQSDWTTARVNLGHEYANTIQRLYFLWHNDNYVGNNPAAAIDNIVIDAYTCAKPIQLTVSGITATEASVTLTSASEENSEWQLMLDSLLLTTHNPVIPMTNLMPAHIYSISARTICGEGDTSLWTPTLTFHTECLPISTIPQIWDFEHNNTGGTTAYPLPSCWNRTGSNLYPYVYNSPANAHSGNCLLYSGGDPSNYIVTLPEIDTNIININNLQLSLYAKSSGLAGVTATKIELGLMSDPSLASSFTAIDSLITLSESYNDYILSLANAPAVGTYPALRLNATGDTNSNGSYNYALIYLDDLRLEKIPVCPKPAQLEASGINTTSATLSWMNGGDESAWDIAYGTPGFNPDTASAMVTVTSNPYTLTGLTLHTTYEVYIRSNCSEENVSEWISAPITFTTTACDTSEQCDYIFICGDGYGDGWNGAYLSIIQNGIITTTVEAIDHHLTETSTFDTLRIKLCDLLSTTFLWTSGNVDAEISLRIIDPNGVTLYDSPNMSAVSSPSLLHFTANCNDIEICPAPTQLGANDITTNSALVTWMAGSNENYWEMQYKLGSVNIWSYVIPITDSSQYLFTELIPNREYHVRVKAICDDINQSGFVTTSFHTESVGIQEATLIPNINLTPNPADHYIELTVNSNVEVKVAVIYNAFGQMIQTVQLTSNHARIDLSNMVAGMYFVRVSGDNVTATKKFIKK